MSVVLYETTGRIARITLNRPESLNAIDDEMPQVRRALSSAVVTRFSVEHSRPKCETFRRG